MNFGNSGCESMKSRSAGLAVKDRRLRWQGPAPVFPCLHQILHSLQASQREALAEFDSCQPGACESD